MTLCLYVVPFLRYSASKNGVTLKLRVGVVQAETANTSVQVGSATIHPSAVVRHLGLHLDSELSMKHHVAKVAAVCFYHLRRLRQIRRRISTEVTNRLVLAVVISRLDYCNSVSAGVMARTIGTSITRTECCKSLIFELTPRDHISPSLLQLHWLPVQYADASSISCAALCTLYTPQDARLIWRTLYVPLAAAGQSRSDLRSSTTSAYLLPRLKTKFGERAFSHAGPFAWNTLPTHVRNIPSPNNFRKLLRTQFFSLASNVY